MPTSGIKIVCEANLSAMGEERVPGLVVTRTTNSNTFTPGHLRNIDQIFLASGEVEQHKHQAGFAPPVVTASRERTFINLDSKAWQGGVTTVVSPGESGPSPALLPDPDYTPATRQRSGRRATATVKEEAALDPEEEEKRRVRRERNKLAAARCRKRRVDQTETLSREVEGWEEKKRLLQEEISALQAEREELQFILAAHATQCRRAEDQQQPAGPRVIAVKEEPAAARPARPASLSLPAKSNSNSLLSQHGITIETPTNAISSLNFEALMEGRTGLTPTNVLTPININVNTSLASLNTPVCSAAFTPGSCGSQRVLAELATPQQQASLVSL